MKVLMNQSHKIVVKTLIGSVEEPQEVVVLTPLASPKS